MSTLAIDPSMPNRAVAKVQLSGPIFEALVTIDLDTGSFTSPLIPIVELASTPIFSLSFDLDGSTLFAASLDHFGVLDLVTGVFDSTPLTDAYGVIGLAFRPSDGELFAMVGESLDSLVRLDPTDGSLLETVGPVGFAGPKNIAFVPEPAPALLVLGGLVAVRIRRARAALAR